MTRVYLSDQARRTFAHSIVKPAGNSVISEKVRAGGKKSETKHVGHLMFYLQPPPTLFKYMSATTSLSSSPNDQDL